MMKRNKRIGSLLILLAMVTSCSEWEEPQINNEKVEVLTPRDSLRTSVVSQLFFWYEVADAIDYELQIVSPSFSQIDRFALDTIVNNNKFQFTLTPGQYEWSVRAFNNSSNTDYTVHTLFIDSTIDLTTQTLILVRPSAFDTSSVLSKNFAWQNLYNAENYFFEVSKSDGSAQQVFQTSTVVDSVSVSFTEEGAYSWKVRGENILTNTIFSERSFYIDTTTPNIPVLQEPDSAAIVDDNLIDIKWSRGTNTGSSLLDSLFLASDEDMQNITHTIISRSNSVVLDTLSDGLYYWRVSSTDAAGNYSGYSDIRSFTRQ